MTRITTHVLDTSEGHPAAGIVVKLEVQAGTAWKEVAAGTTDRDGRASNLGDGKDHPPGTYRLRFLVAEYFAGRKINAFFPFVEVTFTVAQGEHYHVPLLLTPFGYSTYRGS